MRPIVCTSWLALGLGMAIAVGWPTQAADDTSDRAAHPQPGEVELAITRAADHPPDAGQTLAAARTRLIASVEQLERFLGETGSENQQQWQEWLDLASLKAELSSSEANVALLRSIEKRYYLNQPGLERPALVSVRRGIDEFLTACDYATANSPSDQFRQRLSELADCLSRLEAEPNEQDAHRAGLVVAWLAPLGDEGAGVAAAVRAQFGRPNGSAQVSRRFINCLLAQDVQEQSFITDVILGTHTAGPSFTQGRVSFGTIPNQQRGTLEVRLEGQTACPANVAQRGRVSVHSSAQTSIQASKQVHISDLGLTLAPAVASCTTSVQIADVEARSRIIERVAWRRANQLLPQAEQAAAQRAQSVASGKLDERASAALGGANEFFCSKIRAPLIRIGALPERLDFWTDQEHLRLSVVQHSGAQLAAATTAPPFPATYDLAGCAHESLISNFCETTLAGVTVQDQAWLELMNLLTGTSPRPLWVHDRTERWSVTFADQRPVVVRFAGDRIDLTLRLARVTHGTQRFNRPVEIEARFVPEVTVDGPAFIRDGDLAVRIPSGADAETESQVRALLSSKFGAVFPTELQLSGLVPPVGGSLGKLRQLKLVEFRSADGWLTLGYELAEPVLRQLDSRQALNSRAAR